MKTGCCVVGGGPAGLVLGYLLARAGVKVTVLEKHGSFIDDFRGDMIHPSTMELMKELDILGSFLELPHTRTDQFAVEMECGSLALADFFGLKVTCPFIAFMPQRAFLSFIADRAKAFPNFELHMGSRCRGILFDADNRACGVRARQDGREQTIRADLVVGADGRHSLVRELAGLSIRNISSPIDLLWMKIPRNDQLPQGSLRRAVAGEIFVMIDRGDYLQCAYVIPKGSASTIYSESIADFRSRLVALVPMLASSIGALRSWDDVKLLEVRINHLPRWSRPGLICLGDAAHAMSPVSGVGINLAIQDAIAASNILSQPLKDGIDTMRLLPRVQRRRSMPTRIAQTLQYHFEHGPIMQILNASSPAPSPPMLRLLDRSSCLRFLVAWVIGIGVRRERLQFTLRGDHIPQSDQSSVLSGRLP